MQLPAASPRRAAPRALLAAAAVLLALGLAGCGVGAADGGSDQKAVPSGGTPDLEIVTTSLPDASNGVGYEPTQLQASGARDTLSWSVTDGELPPGLSLTPDGRVLGTPEAVGYYEFTAEVTDGHDADTRTLAIAVDSFGMTVVGGLLYGDACGGHPVSLRCAGAAGPVEIEVLSSGSGGSLHALDAAAGTATWVPGLLDGRTAVDVLRARDTATGVTAEVDLTVAPDPFDGHVARFGSSDVWYLDFSRKHGVHAYATDWHAALADMGLRSPEAVDAVGSEVDRLADLVTRVATLRHLNAMFLRNEDGTAGAAGLPISFPLDAPGPGYAMPAAGSWLSGAPNQFSVMAVCDGPNPMVVGSAFTDAPGNPLQEHNAPGGALGALGVFVNSITPMVHVGYRLHGDALVRDPVTHFDVEALKALLYDLPSPGDRYDLLRYQVNALARSVAFVAAHEMGHSLGLEHSPVTTMGSIMNAGTVFSQDAEYFFLPEDLDVLRMGLPGPGRGAAAQQKPSSGLPVAAALPGGGLQVCNGCAGH